MAVYMYIFVTSDAASCQKDWQKIFSDEHRKHAIEMENWKATLIEVVKLMDEMKDKLKSLLGSLNKDL